MAIEVGRDNACFIHLTLVPYVASAGEIKTKPTQHSVKELREIGIQPDVLLCRADRPLPPDERRKIALFTNVPVEAVISARDMDSIYKIPGMLHAQDLDDIVCRKLGLAPPPANLSSWERLVYALEHPQRTVNIALVGKYVDLTESYKSLSEALIHAGIHTCAKIKIQYIDSENIDTDGVACLEAWTRYWCRRLGKRGVEGKIKPIAMLASTTSRISHLSRHAGSPSSNMRACRGVRRRAQHGVRPRDAAPGDRTDHRMAGSDGRIEHRDARSDLGGTMRLGGQECVLEPESLARPASTGRAHRRVRHRHRYEVNNHYLPRIKQAGLRV